MSTHTPGPWSTETYNPEIKAERAAKKLSTADLVFLHEDRRRSRRAFVGVFNGMFEVAKVHWTPETDAEAKATASLIAAAPELLDAVRALHDALSDILEEPASAERLTDSRRRAALAVIDQSFAAIQKAEG